MNLPTMNSLLDWLEEEFRNLNLGPESNTARGGSEHEMPAQETLVGTPQSVKPHWSC
jgi:hypothetical protein